MSEVRDVSSVQLADALAAMMAAYERRVRSECTPEQLAAQPWRCAEYIAAEAAMRRERQRQRILADPDDEPTAGDCQ